MFYSLWLGVASQEVYHSGKPATQDWIKFESENKEAIFELKY